MPFPLAVRRLVPTWGKNRLSPPFTPANVSSATLVEWQRADVGVLNASGSPAANNDAVKTWKDQTANANDLLQATVANQPTFKTNATPSGLPAVSFNGTANWMSRTFISSLSQPFSLLVVFQLQAVTASECVLCASDSNVQLFVDGTSKGWDFYAGSTKFINQKADLNWHVGLINVNGASSAFQLDGGSLTTFSATPGADSLAGLFLGALQNAGPGQFANVLIAEAVVFSGNPNASDSTNVIQGEGQKYGLVAAADAFSQASGTDLSVTGWTLFEGDYQIQSGGGAQCISQSGGNQTTAVRNCNAANVVLNEKIKALSSASHRQGLALRVNQSGGKTTGFAVTVNPSTALLEIIEIDADVITVRASAAITISASTTYPLQASANGTTINASFNNATMAQYALASTNQTVTTHGIYDSATNNALHTNWSAWL